MASNVEHTALVPSAEDRISAGQGAETTGTSTTDVYMPRAPNDPEILTDSYCDEGIGMCCYYCWCAFCLPYVPLLSVNRGSRTRQVQPCAGYEAICCIRKPWASAANNR
jgi:hypothetical protein